MLDHAPTYTSFTAANLDAVHDFYAGTLQVPVAMDARPNMVLFTSGGTRFMVYAKPDHVPAAYTVLNFAVEDLAAVVRHLRGRKVTLERYDGAAQDEHGIATRGPIKVAWLKDPAGNIVGLSEGL